MTYVCLIEFALQTAPHSEPLVSDNLDEAIVEAWMLLDRHVSGFAAHIYESDHRVASVRRPERALATRHPPL